MDGENQTKARTLPCQELHCFTDFGIRLLIAPSSLKAMPKARISKPLFSALFLSSINVSPPGNAAQC